MQLLLLFGVVCQRTSYFNPPIFPFILSLYYIISIRSKNYVYCCCCEKILSLTQLLLLIYTTNNNSQLGKGKNCVLFLLCDNKNWSKISLVHHVPISTQSAPVSQSFDHQHFVMCKHLASNVLLSFFSFFLRYVVQVLYAFAVFIQLSFAVLFVYIFNDNTNRRN